MPRDCVTEQWNDEPSRAKKPEIGSLVNGKFEKDQLKILLFVDYFARVSSATLSANLKPQKTNTRRPETEQLLQSDNKRGTLATLGSVPFRVVLCFSCKKKHLACVSKARVLLKIVLWWAGLFLATRWLRELAWLARLSDKWRSLMSNRLNVSLNLGDAVDGTCSPLRSSRW